LPSQKSGGIDLDIDELSPWFQMTCETLHKAGITVPATMSTSYVGINAIIKTGNSRLVRRVLAKISLIFIFHMRSDGIALANVCSQSSGIFANVLIVEQITPLSIPQRLSNSTKSFILLIEWLASQKTSPLKPGIWM
jgi:hypothetical protein